MSLDINLILSPAVVRIANDAMLKGLVGIPIQVWKGPKRPDEKVNQKGFTVHILTSPQDPDSKVINGTLLINFYCPNYEKDRNANVELMGPVAARICELFDDKPFAITGHRNFNLVVQEPLGPLWDSTNPDESFMSIRIKFNIQ